MKFSRRWGRAGAHADLGVMMLRNDGLVVMVRPGTFRTVFSPAHPRSRERELTKTARPSTPRNEAGGLTPSRPSRQRHTLRFPMATSTQLSEVKNGPAEIGLNLPYVSILLGGTRITY